MKGSEQLQDQARPGESEASPAIKAGRVPPEICVSNRSDFAAGEPRRIWVDAARDSEDLTNTIQERLTQATGRAEDEVIVHDYRRFGVYQLQRSDDFETISSVARGIERHGLAYSALARYIGSRILETDPDRFTRSYLGEWPSLQAFVREMADALGLEEYLALLPKPIRHFVRLDFQAIAREVELELMVVSHESGVWVFDPLVSRKEML
jgi:antirestriction protein